MDNIAISLQNVCMKFNMSKDKIMGLKEYIVKAVKRELFYESFTALHDISLTINKGEVFGIMGLNGAGKSTLLKIIAGVFKPTTGTVTINGALTPLLELGAGFDPEFSARDNVFLNGAMFGYDPKYMESKYEDIWSFTELDASFQDVAVKNFSSGMIARLGLAIATSIQSEIVIIDEIMGVGDFKFRQKSSAKIKEMIESGVTALIVSHDINQIRSMCSRAVLLKQGRVVCIGDVDEVCKVYGDG